MLRIRMKLSDIYVETSGDPYGDSFWKSIEECEYEPDTLSFLENNLTPDCVFMDIGAANGAMTLLAAQLAKNVVSYEPDPTMYDILKRNVQLNKGLAEKICVKNSGISNKSTKIEFSIESDKSIFSSIVVGSEKTGKLIEVLSLAEEIESVNSSKSKLIIKMDIEGAEWRILNDELVLQALKTHRAKLLLAVHPGFYRPHVKLVRGLDRLSLTIWHMKNYLESVRTYNRLYRYCDIYRTNRNPIRNARIFATLVFAGYHEFILTF